MGLFLPGSDRRWASYDLEVAEKLGLNEAIILAQIVSSIEGHIDRHETERFFRDGRWWMYDSMPSLCKNTALGMDAIRRVVTRLKKLEVIACVQYELAEGRGRYWYTINGENLAKVLASPPPVQNRMVPPPTCAKPQGAPVQNHRVGVAKPQGGTLAKPQGLSITPISITAITETITPETPLATVTALPIKKPRGKKTKELKYTADDLEVAKDWLAYAERESPWRKGSKTWTVEIFADGLAKVRDGVTIDGEKLNAFGLRAILKFVNPHSFWASRCTSPVELLKITDKESGRRKIDTVLSQMKPHTLRQEEKIKSWAPLSDEEVRNPF